MAATVIRTATVLYFFSFLFFNRISMHNEMDRRFLDDENCVLFKVLYNLYSFNRNGIFTPLLFFNVILAFLGINRKDAEIGFLMGEIDIKLKQHKFYVFVTVCNIFLI